MRGDRQAVELRHRDVDNQGIDPALTDPFKRLRSVGCGFDLEPHLTASIRHQLDDRRIVVCDQHPRCGFARLEYGHGVRLQARSRWLPASRGYDMARIDSGIITSPMN